MSVCMTNKKFAALKSVFSKFDQSDSMNLTKLTSEFADLDGIYETKVKGLTSQLCGSYSADDTTLWRPVVEFKHNGICIGVMNVTESSADEYVTHLPCSFVDYGDHTCHVVVKDMPKPHGVGIPIDMPLIIAPSTRGLAQKIVGLLQDKRLCELCGQVIPDTTMHQICARCACWEMDAPCCGCKRKIGRSWSNDVSEHPVCKKRRTQ